jgi:hypothetical protein
MPEQASHLSDKPSVLSVSLLIRSLKTDSATRGVSPRNYAHRSRVIRQQTKLLAQEMAGEPAEKSRELAKGLRKASSAPDQREEGGQG